MKQKLKKKRNKIYVWIGAVLVSAFFIGCVGNREPRNAESLLQMMEKESEAVKSMKSNLVLEAETAEAEQVSGVKLDLDIETERKSETVHANGKITVNVQGGGYSLDTEIYQMEEQDENVSYTHMQNTWMRSLAEDAEIELSPEFAEEIAKEAKGMTLAEKPEKVNEKMCYKLTGMVGGEVLEGVANPQILNSLGLGGRLTDDTLEQMNFPCEIWIDQEEFLPVRIEIDMKSEVEKVAGYAGNEIRKYDLELTMLEYNTVEKLEIPKEVRSQAETGTHRLEKDTFTAEDVKEMSPASKSEMLGETWDSYTIRLNDTVVTLPCEAAELEAAGLQLDPSVTSADELVEIGEYTLGYYVDAAGNRLKVLFVNPSTETLPVRQCLIGSIAADADSLAAGGLTIQFPGEIMLGSAKEDVLKKYGECEDIFENDSVSMYTWHDETYYFRSCQIHFDATGTVISMQMNCQE